MLLLYQHIKQQSWQNPMDYANFLIKTLNTNLTTIGDTKMNNKYEFLIDQEIYVIQTTQNDVYFFKGFTDYKKAAEHDWQDNFFIDEQDQIDAGTDENKVLSYEEQKENHRNTFEEFTKQQLIDLEEKYGLGSMLGILK